VVDQEIPEHRAAEGPADGRCHHRVSQSWVPLSPNQSAKNSGHFLYPWPGPFCLSRSSGGMQTPSACWQVPAG